jgi:hypothetical protein
VTVTEFLEARITEDEAAARRCEKAFPGSWDVEDRGYRAHVVCDGPYFHHVSELDQQHTNVEHIGGALQMIADFNPARVLAECAAKRQVIEAALDDANSIDLELACCHSVEKLRANLCPVFAPGPRAIRALAAVYKDHPDYRQEWAL